MSDSLALAELVDTVLMLLQIRCTLGERAKEQNCQQGTFVDGDFFSRH